ncbi:MAG: type I restriction enzyme HsdR N-terminal domain-containing protein [Bdellovibrionota bacterium]
MSVDIKKELRLLLPHLQRARDEKLNEADTSRRVCKVLEDALGYDGFSEITREKQIKGKYVDLAVKLDGVVQFLIEVKSADTDLRDRHIEQAQHYAATGNIPWVVLTNGISWVLYHLSFDEGIEYERAFAVDLLDNPLNGAAEALSLLHRQSLLRGDLETFWKKQTALSPQSIGRALFHEDTLARVRRLIRKQKGILIDEEDLGRAIQALFSAESREQMGPFKIRRRSSTRKKAKTTEGEPGSTATSPLGPGAGQAADVKPAPAIPTPPAQT